MASVAERVFSLIKQTVETQGVSLWDVRFLKEGASWYLRVFIDSEKGITIDDCTNVSHAVDPIIDEADPIDKAYFLEVCSPGIERELSREEHFNKYIGKKIKVRLYRAVDSVKEFEGILKEYSDMLVLETENGEISFEKQNISKANACDL